MTKEKKQSSTDLNQPHDSLSDLTLPLGSATPLQTLKRLAEEIRTELGGADLLTESLTEKLGELTETAESLLTKYREQRKGAK